MNQSHFFVIAFSLLLLGLFSTNLETLPTGQTVAKPAFSSNVFQDYVTFQAASRTTSRRSYVHDVHVIELPEKPVFCTLEGVWETDADHWGRQRGSCHGATGSFFSYIDKDQQYVVNDPGYFHWAGNSKPRNDPLAEEYDGYVLYMHPCDNLYYREPRFYVTGRIIDFGTAENVLTISWNSYNEELIRPAVDFKFDLTCELSPRSFSLEEPVTELPQPTSETTPPKVFYQRADTPKQTKSDIWIAKFLKLVYG